MGPGSEQLELANRIGGTTLGLGQAEIGQEGEGHKGSPCPKCQGTHHSFKPVRLRLAEKIPSNLRPKTETAYEKFILRFLARHCLLNKKEKRIFKLSQEEMTKKIIEFHQFLYTQSKMGLPRHEHSTGSFLP
eukprot:gene14303-4206_t